MLRSKSHQNSVGSAKEISYSPDQYSAILTVKHVTGFPIQLQEESGIMELFDQLMNPNWKNIPMEHKLVLASSVVRYFVNPLLPVANIQPVYYQMGGIKTETFTVDINGAAFVFVPGHKEAVLGWDSGINGLDPLDISSDRKEMYLAIENCLKLSVQGAEFLHDDHWMKKKIGPIHNLEELEDLVNSQMSQLRTTEIPPLLVEVSPNYVGMTKVGDYAVINGKFEGQSDWFSIHEKDIHQALMPSATGSSVFADFPAHLVQNDSFFLRQNEDLDSYTVFAPCQTTYAEIRKQLERDGMGLLSSNEWEYCCGASTRRLFRWGNQLHRNLFEPEDSHLYKKNMFGLEIANMGWGPELVEDGLLVKGGWISIQAENILEKLLPYATYYENHADALNEKQQEPLAPGYYCARRSIRIEM